MPVVAHNLTGLDISCASTAGYENFKSLMQAAGATGHLYFRHGFDSPTEISLYLRGVGSTGAPRFLTASIGAQITLEFAAPVDAHKFIAAYRNTEGSNAIGMRISASFVIIEPDQLNLAEASQCLCETLLLSTALRDVLPQYDNLESYVRDLLTHEHAFRDEYMADYTYEKIAAAITEETFPKVIEYMRRHSPNRKDTTAVALELSIICGILIEERECRYPQLGATLNEIARSLTDAHDLADVAELKALLEPEQD